MASYQYLNSSKQPRDSGATHTHGRAYSKAQMCLFNILHIISTIPPSANSKPEAFFGAGDDDHSGSSPRGNKGIGIDLNTSLCSVDDSGESESFGDNGSDERVREKSVEISEATDTQVRSFKKVDKNGVDHEEAKSEESEQDRKRNDGGDVETVPFGGRRHDEGNNCLDLLIEAAKLVSVEENESNSEEASGERGLSYELRSERGRGIEKQKQRWVIVDVDVDLCSEMEMEVEVEAEEASPVVRSKRGRSQVLPYRFRDSVVEPLKRSGRSRPYRKKRLIGC